MPADRIHQTLGAELEELGAQGTLKGAESVITRVIPAAGDRGPRVHLDGERDKEFLKMNSNNYLGMSLRKEVIEAEEEASREYGAGPGAVRFISGTHKPHIELEERLAAFHGREAAMIFSSAYATTLGVMTPLLSKETAVISDDLNHNCIINAIRLARPKAKRIYQHLNLEQLDTALGEVAGECRRAIVVTDGIFSMRGDHAPLPDILEVVRKHDSSFEENALLMVDDSHGVGAFGLTGRGTEEFTGCDNVDILVATLGKALGVNGGYVAASKTVIDYLREKAPMYIYSNPITPAEAAAALKALEILDSDTGRGLLDHLRAMTKRFEDGLGRLGLETIPGEHPVVPLMVRDTERTSALVAHLRHHGILATGLNFPVVPKGDEEIRFQISADHTEADVDETLAALEGFSG
jgi:glycine C-acetyltransferase